MSDWAVLSRALVYFDQTGYHQSVQCAVFAARRHWVRYVQEPLRTCRNWPLARPMWKH